MLFSTSRVSWRISPKDIWFGGGVDRSLAGHKDEIARAYGRRIRAARRGHSGRRDSLDHRISPLC